MNFSKFFHTVSILLVIFILAGSHIACVSADATTSLASDTITPVIRPPHIDNTVKNYVGALNPSVRTDETIQTKIYTSDISNPSVSIENKTYLVDKPQKSTVNNSYHSDAAIASVSSQINAINSYPYNPDKKIIEFGCDAPAASWIKDNIVSMEQKPFDGVAFVPGNKYVNIWQPDNWSTNSKYLDLASLSAIQWNKFRGNNYLLLFSNNLDSYNLNYWDDASWTKIEENMKALAKAAHDNGCAGILFDQEYYASQGPSPWSYSVNGKGHTVTETQAQIRKRGAQVMNAWQSQYPDITILYTDLTTDDTNYDLVPYWVNGMLDVIGPNARLVEGNEHAYYFTHSQDWFNRYDEYKISKSLVSYLDPANQNKWTKNVEVGNSIYWECVATSPSDLIQDRWEHNAYMGLATSDKWVWAYSNCINWWGVPPEYQPIGGLGITAIPSGAVEGISAAKEKYFSNKKLGWDWKGTYPETSVIVTITNANPITVTATTTGGSITNVDFYLNNVLVESDTSKPYSLDTTNIPAGSYTLIARARAWNDKSYWGTSQPVDITLGSSTKQPTIIKITSNSGYNSGNAAVTITGTNFRSGAVVKLTKGSVTKIATVKQITSTQVKCTLPTKGMTSGVYTLVITNKDGTKAVKQNAYTVKAAGAKPTIKSLSSKTATTSVSKAVYITGTNFRSNIAVSIKKGTTVKTLTGISRISSSKVKGTLPKGLKAGYWTLTVKNSDGTSATKTNAIKISGSTTAVQTSIDKVNSDPVTGMSRPQVLAPMASGNPKTTEDTRSASSIITPPKISGLNAIATP